jgi:hypothetical protein
LAGPFNASIKIDLKEHLHGNIPPNESFPQLLGFVGEKTIFFRPLYLVFHVNPVCLGSLISKG